MNDQHQLDRIERMLVCLLEGMILLPFQIARHEEIVEWRGEAAGLAIISKHHLGGKV